MTGKSLETVQECIQMTKMEWNLPNGSNLRRLTNIGSVRMSYGICCAPFLFGKPLVKNTFFKSFPKKRSDCECQKSGFGFDPKNPLRVWILWIHDPFLNLPKKTQNPFLNSEIRIWIFPQKTHPQSLGILHAMYITTKQE